MIELNQEMLNSVIVRDNRQLRRLIKLSGSMRVLTLRSNLLIRTAASCGNYNAVVLLLELGAGPRAVYDSALRLASVNGHARVVRLLIDAGCDVNAVSGWGFRLAARNGYIAVIRALTRGGVDLARFGNDVLEQASLAGDDLMLNYLRVKMRGIK